MDLKFLRKSILKVTQAELAYKIGVTPGYIGQIESKSLSIPDNILDKIKLKFNLDTEQYKSYNTSNKINTTAIKFYDIPVTGGDIDVFDDLQNEEPSFSLYSDDYKGCEYGFRVHGDSMHPIISSGDYVIIKEITEKDLIIYGEIYLIFTTDQRIVKRLSKSKTESDVLCVSENNKYDSFPLAKKRIKRLFAIKGVIKRLSD